MIQEQKILPKYFVKGDAVPKQSFRASGTGGYQPARVKAWQETVAIDSQQVMRGIDRFNQPFEGKIAIELIFVLGHKRVVDLDNLSKGVLDGIKNIVITDDHNAYDLFIRKIIQPGDHCGVAIFIKEYIPLDIDDVLDLVWG
jgi:Holliday junction resolvase RusA-like endonuclease